MTLGTIQTGIVLFTSFISVKLTSNYIGPAGLASVAQMQGLLQICSGVIGLTLGTAMIRLGAEYGMSERFGALASTAMRAAVIAGLVATAIAALFPTAIWRALFGNSAAFSPAVIALGLGAMAMSIQSVIGGAMNGAHETALVSGSRILAACVGLLGYALPMMLWSERGALFGVGLGAILQCVAVYWLMRSRSKVPAAMFVGAWNRGEFKAIVTFLPMMIALSVADPMAMIMMRKHVLTTMSAETAGILQASYRLAEVTMTVLTAGASLYSLPKLGSLSGNKPALAAETRRIVFNIAAISLGLGIFVYLLRKPIILLIFNHSFIGVTDLMLFQMVWLPLKSVAWACGLILVSQLRQKSYIAAQLIGPVIFIGTTLNIDYQADISRIILASCLAAFVQMLVSIVAVRDLLFGMRMAKAG